jgi:hypothetical protein
MAKYMCAVKAKAIHSLNLALGIPEISEIYGWVIDTMRYITEPMWLCASLVGPTSVTYRYKKLSTIQKI